MLRIMQYGRSININNLPLIWMQLFQVVLKLAHKIVQTQVLILSTTTPFATVRLYRHVQRYRAWVLYSIS